MRRNQRGLTLIELMIALGISSVAILITVSTTANVFQTLRNSEMRNEAGIDFLMLSEYFSKRVPSAGGPNLGLDTAVIVENNCRARANFPNCQQSDRLTLVTQLGAPTCTIERVTGRRYRLQTASGVCCLSSRNLDNLQVMVTKGTDHVQKYVSSVDNGRCEVTVEDGPLEFTDQTPSTGGPNVWDGAMIVPIQIDTYYFDASLGRLIRYRYNNEDALTGDNLPIADRMVDLQLAVGYDFAPADGGLTENSTGDDEWLYNNPAAGEALGQGYFSGASPSAMRMLSVGIIVGAPAASRISHATRLLDGPTRDSQNMVLRGGISKFGLRSLFIFQ